MCAIGLSGQLGLHGLLPWEGDQRPEFVRDVERFFAQTSGHVLMAGPVTIASVPAWASEQITLAVVRSGEPPEQALARFPGRTIFIGGGPPVWAAYAHLIEHWDITRLPYDGPADRWFDPAWLVKARTVTGL